MIFIKKSHIKSRKLWSLVCLSIAFLCWFWFFSLPDPLFQDPTSTVIEDKDGMLLGARIALDGQWRFPSSGNVPEKFKTAITMFEDRRFYHHPGFDPLAIARALIQNTKSGKVESGASTLTMQVIRLSRKGKARTYFEKLLEVILAVRLECSTDKNQILALYAAYAPYGGNVVGLEAAAWRYFGRPPHQLSWAETATLAVLPNAPALIHPGKNREKLQLKRNKLLKTLYEHEFLSETSLKLALLESLPKKPKPLPNKAPHLLSRMTREQPQQKIRTTLHHELQQHAVKVLDNYHKKLILNDIHNGAILILENQSGHVLAYVGNSGNTYDGLNEHAVDMIPAKRSTGSLLKPFLYAGLLQDGQILPQTLLPDIPTNFSGYTPKNFDLNYEGAVPADRALARSRNIPAVRMQRMYGSERFLFLLRKMGLLSLDKPASHYGLALVLGGAESSMWELASTYSGLARTLLSYQQKIQWRNPTNFQAPIIVDNHLDSEGEAAFLPKRHSSKSPLQPGVIWYTLQALKMVNRPEAHGLWEYFSSAKQIAWKTGTSFGFRDAWAIGVTPQFTVAVWIGNADGEGRPGLTGITTAAPVMFEVFRFLDLNEPWFTKPSDELENVQVCQLSGHRATNLCTTVHSISIPKQGLNSPPCPYHKNLFLDSSEQWQVNSSCYPVHEMVQKTWFILSPGMAWFYRQKHPSYKPAPPFLSNCESESNREVMSLIYPRENARILVPVELSGEKGRTIFEAAHQISGKTIFWHLDQEYLGATDSFHQLALNPLPGKHKLVLIDEDGTRIERHFEILKNELTSDEK